jgi:uncharacterized protein YjbI with pentapeptide repeats
MDDKCHGAMTEKEQMKQLRERWAAAGKIDLRRALAQAESPFGLTSAGLLDYRGVRITDSLHRLSFSHVDMSFATMDFGQLVAEVADCLFCACAFESNIGKKFTRCSFNDAKLVNSVILGTFDECTFVNTNLSKVRASQGRFSACVFEGANLRKASFFDCTFDGSRIKDCKLGSGSFAGSSFSDCVVEGADFSRTVMEKVTGIDWPP